MRPPARRHRLRWRSTAEGLRPDPATARALAALEAMHKKTHPE